MTMKFMPSYLSRGLYVLLFMFMSYADAVTTSTYQPLLLEVLISGQDTGQVFTFMEDAQKNLYINSEDAKTLRLRIPVKNAIDIQQQTYYPLTAFAGLTYKLDASRLTLNISAPPQDFELSTLTVRNNNLLIPPPAPFGGYLNYSFFGQEQGSDNPNVYTLMLTPDIFSPYGYLNSGMMVQNTNMNSMNNEQNTQFLRLNSAFVQDQPAHMTTLSLGDAYTNAPSWGQSVDFGGISYGTNFSTQPNFNTLPLPATSGVATLPSTVNVYVNNTLTASKNINQGPFNINNIPTVNGFGQINLVTTNIMGQEQVYNVPYYSSNNLLAQGLSDYSYAAGFVRENYGLDSNDYGPFLGQVTEQYGFNNRLTVEGDAQTFSDEQTLGGGLNYLVGTIGVVNFDFAASHAPGTAGDLGVVGFQRQFISGLSYGFNIQVSSAQFTEIGLNPGEGAPSVQNQFFISLPMGTSTNMGLSDTQVNNRNGTPNSNFATLSYNTNISKEWFLNLSIISNIGGQVHTQEALLGLSSYFGNNSFNISQTLQDNANQTQVSLGQSLPIGTGFGYQLQYDNTQNQPQNYQASVSAQNEIGTYSVTGAHQGEINGYQLYASGAVVLLGNNVYLTRTISNSFGLVQVPGVPDVTVYSENEPIGKTDAAGNVLIPILNPYQNNMIAIEGTDLPLSVNVAPLKQNTIPYNNSGVIVKFPVTRIQEATLSAVNVKQQPIAVGEAVELNGAPAAPVGFNGLLYFDAVKSGINHVLIAAGTSTACSFDFTYQNNLKQDLPNLGTFICKENHAHV